MRLRLVIILCMAVAGRAAAQESAPEFFEKRVRPVLATKCFACHTNSAMGGLRVDSRQALLDGGKTGPAIVPGKPEESLLIRAVRHSDDKLKMPMGGKLKDQEIADLEAWVKMGAPWPDAAGAQKQAPPKGEFTLTPEQRKFWAFQALRNPKPPRVTNAKWPKTTIDQFVMAALEAQGLNPSPPADKRTLIRRATFDLTGLPPTPDEVNAFLSDASPQAFAKVIDRLLASPHYGERWARYWLDVARYAEDDVAGKRQGYVHAWRYRDWVVQALNRDVPYDLFVKAQIAGDLLKGQKPEDVLPGLGMFGIGPWYFDTDQQAQARSDERDDRVDVLTRGFLGLTVACARCHDQKQYDPVSTKDYYALAGVFASSGYHEYPLVPADQAKRFQAHQEKIKELELSIKQFTDQQSRGLAEILARKTSSYMLAAWKTLRAPKLDVSAAAKEADLDLETLKKWVRYLGDPEREHPFLKAWDTLLAHGGTVEEVQKAADEFQKVVISVLSEKRAVDEENRLTRSQHKPKEGISITHLPNGVIHYDDFCSDCTLVFKPFPREKYHLWIDLIEVSAELTDFAPKPRGVLLYKDKELERFLGGAWKTHLDSLRNELEELRKTSPAPYPYLMGIADNKPRNLRVHLRGSPYSLGDEVPRRFPAVLAAGEPAGFRSGSGRLELAQAIVDHPLTARVIVNRLWLHHFGRGIVASPSNFGQLGERPTHPELLEYLASRLRQQKWSLKALHREMMLSATYQLGNETQPENRSKDPDNRYLWRANRLRLDAETIRDSLLAVGGNLDPTVGGASSALDAENRRRTLYGRISRSELDSYLTLFDFPNPSLSSEQRNVTNVPLQKLFFLNSDIVSRQSQVLAARLGAEIAGDDAARIKKAYELLYGREVTESELRMGLDFLQKANWERYAQVLLSANEFLFVN